MVRSWFVCFFSLSDVQIVKLCDRIFPQESVLLPVFHVILETEYMPLLYLLFVTKTPLEECNDVVEQHVIMLIPEHLDMALLRPCEK